MDNDDKKKNEIEKKEDEKDNKPLTQDEQLKQLEDEIKNMLEDMKVVLGDDAVPDVKIVSTQKVSKKKILLFQLIEVLLSIGILVGLTGYISWFKCDKLYFYFIVIGGMTIIEFILGYIVNRFMVKAIFYSFGLVMLVPSVIAFIFAGLLIPLVGAIDIGKLLIVCVLYMIIKRIIMRLIKGNNSSFRIQTIRK